MIPFGNDAYSTVNMSHFGTEESTRLSSEIQLSFAAFYCDIN